MRPVPAKPMNCLYALIVVLIAAAPGAVAGQEMTPRDHATMDHALALEQIGHRSLDAVCDEFDANRFAESFLSQTSASERRTLLRSIRDAASSAAGAMLEQVGDETRLTLGGPSKIAIVFAVEHQPPYKLAALRTAPVTSASPALTLTWDNVAEHFDTLARAGFAGVVHLTRDGKDVLHKAYGSANRSLAIPMRTDTIFGIGSTPIDFTVAAIYLLAQQDKLSLDDPITRFFDDVGTDKRAMTIRHLLNGRSGLPDFHHEAATDWDADLAWIDRDTAVARILAQPLLFAPGQGQAHSHSAYGLAAAIIERISGQGYFAFLSQHLFGPAGMTRTGMYGADNGFTLADFAVGYGAKAVGVPNIPPNWGPTSWLIMGSGGMYSTLEDMLRFYRKVRGGELLEPQYAARYQGDALGIGGSERGFYLFHASRGGSSEALMIINGEGRTAAMRTLSDALGELVVPRN